MPMTGTDGRARWRRPYSTARFTIVATLFQFSPYWRAVAPTHLPRQHGHRVAQGCRHPCPRLSPWKILHPHPAPGTLYSPRAVAQLPGQFPHGQVAPLPLLSDVVNLPASSPADPAAQEPLAQAVDVHSHALPGFFHLGHRVGFQAQLFSDKRLYEPLGRFPFVFLGRKLRNLTDAGCFSNACLSATPSIHMASTAITLFG